MCYFILLVHLHEVIHGPKDFKNMNVIQLKEYLQNRGVSVSGHLEPALVEIATAVNKMMQGIF